MERPAAVVKELLENSIDAESRKISVFLLQGGRKEIRVVDNGVGMSSEDALLALEPHATSKIKSIDDLNAIRSLGFRGEAIPSISAVSRFELETREEGGVSGTRITMEGGILRDVREIGCPVGCSITVRDLFHNVPARRKFLRTVETEMAHISEIFLRVAMARSEIHLQLSHGGRLLYDLPHTGVLAERAARILGCELAETLHPFSMEIPSRELRFHGLASPPELQRGNHNGMFACVNGRPVRDPLLNRSILAAYDSVIPKGKFPVVVLFVEIPPAHVDVNIHPTKREVRFQNPREVAEAARGALAAALGEIQGKRWRTPLPATKETVYQAAPLCLEEPQARPAPGPPAEGPKAVPSPPIPVQASVFEPPARFEEDAGATDEATPPIREDPLFSRLPVIGQLGSAYILLESPEGLVLIDQHAAHERILFDRMAGTPEGKASQRLLQPAVVDFFPREADTIKQRAELLQEIGFDIEPFGGNSFVIHSVPAALSSIPPGALLREIVEGDMEDREIPKIALIAALAKAAACRGAIKAGQKLRNEEIRELLKDLDNTGMSATCPHGRPLWWKLTFKEIARFFHRT